MKTGRYILFFALLLIFISGCKPKEDNPPLRVGLMSDVNSIPYIVAKQQGYLDGVAELTVFRSAMDRDSALHSGSLDGCSSDALAVCLARNGGFPMYITGVTDGNYGLLAGASSGITDASGLRGREIAMSLNTIIEYVSDCILSDLGVDPGAVLKTAVPQTPIRLELLEAGQIDAIAVPEPYVFTAAQGGAAVIGTALELGIRPAVMCFTADAIETRPDDLKKLAAAYDRALEYMARTPDFLPAVIEELGLPESTLEMTLPDYRPSGLPEPVQVERAAQWLFDKGLVDELYTYGELVWKP